MFNLLPKDTVFFDLFESLAERVVSGAKALAEMAERYPASKGVISRIRDEEHAADELSHQTLERLDRTFITPFDREDIHELVGGMDDIIDEIDAVAKRFPMYHVDCMEPIFQKQAVVLVAACTAVRDAVHRLRTSHRLQDLSPNLIEIHRLENEGDENHQAAVSHLFEGTVDALNVIKWMDLFSRVEKDNDKCEDVSNTLERITLKNG